MIRTLLATMLLTALAPGQTPASPTESSTRLHAAWLREVLDLDTRGAIAEYEAVAQDARPTNPERWVAVARLLELQRTGKAGTQGLRLADAPESLTEAIARLEPPMPVPIAALLAEPAAVWQSLSSNGVPLPDLRPLAEAVQRWHSNLGLGDRQRLAQRFNRNRPQQGEAPRMRWANAFSVLRAEQQGLQARAATLRRFDFPEWRPPTPAADPTTLLPRIRQQLDSWLADTDLVESQRTQLRTLRDAVDQRPAKEIVEMLTRVPLIGERLLAEPKPADVKPGEPKPGETKLGDGK